jgi:hypothetical protein
MIATATPTKPAKRIAPAIVNFIAANSNYPADLKQAVATANNDVAQLYYVLDPTGTFVYVSTNADLSAPNPQSVVGLNKAMASLQTLQGAMVKGATKLYDYDAVTNLISASGDWMSSALENKTFTYTSSELTLDTTIIKNILGAIESGPTALGVAQAALASIGDELSLASKDMTETNQIAQLILIAEGMGPFAFTKLRMIVMNESQVVSSTKSNCHRSYSETISFTYQQADYTLNNPVG